MCEIMGTGEEAGGKIEGRKGKEDKQNDIE